MRSSVYCPARPALYLQLWRGGGERLARNGKGPRNPADRRKEDKISKILQGWACGIGERLTSCRLSESWVRGEKAVTCPRGLAGWTMDEGFAIFDLEVLGLRTDTPHPVPTVLPV